MYGVITRHAACGGHVAEIAIDCGELLDGWPPPRALRLVDEWADTHRGELRRSWDRARARVAERARPRPDVLDGDFEPASRPTPARTGHRTHRGQGKSARVSHATSGCTGND
jgi:hypothetical protein